MENTNIKRQADDKELIFTLDNIESAARAFIGNIGHRRIFLFHGEMGAGKTTFISEVCRLLGATDDFGSPTFSLVNEYEDAAGNPIYHFDLYRIESPAEAFDMGALEYFESGALCFVEWPDRLGPLTPEGSVIVTLAINPDGSRSLRESAVISCKESL